MENNKIIKATVWYTISLYLSKGIGFITIPVFSRILTNTEYGLSDNFFAIYNILYMVGTLSLSASLISARFDYKDEINSYIKTNIIFGMVNSITLFGIYMLLRDFLNPLSSLSTSYYILMFITIIVNPAFDMFIMLKQFRYDYKIVSFLNIFIPLFGTVLSILLIHVLRDRLYGKILGGQIPLIIFGLLTLFYFFKEGKSINMKYVRYAIPICIPYTIHSLSGAVLNFSDRIMITNVCGADRNSLYSMAYSVSQIVLVMWSAMNVAFFPWLSEKLHEKKYDEIKAYSNKYISFFIVFVLGVLLFVPEILKILGGEKYKDSITSVPPLIISCVYLFLYSLYVNIEQYEKKTSAMALTTFCCAIINIALNIIFIPQFGYFIASYTTMVSYCLMLIFHYSFIRKLKLNICYNNLFVMGVAGAFLILSVPICIIYKYSAVRMSVILIYTIFLVIYIKRNISVLKFIIKIDR